MICALAVAALPIGVVSIIGAFSLLFLLVTLLLIFFSGLAAVSDSTGVPVIAIVAVAAAGLIAIGWNNAPVVRIAETNASTKSNYAGKAFVDWLEARKDLEAYIESGKPYPVFIAAANGGGSYAAFHAALALARIQDSCPRFAQHLFAISGVSGGSLGASVFAALAATRATNEPKAECHLHPVDKGFFQEATQKFFTHDLLIPLLAAGMYPDLLQRFIPWRIASFDRTRQLERAIEVAWARSVPANPKQFEEPLRQLWSEAGPVPALILNTTEVRSGGVEVVAPFYFELDAYGSQTELWLGTDISLRLSTAIGMSARFPWVTPPALLALPNRDGGTQKFWQFVDGGYFENSGIETAHQLILGLQSAVERNNKENGRAAHELLVPLRGRDQPVRVAFSLLSLRTLDAFDTSSLHSEITTPLTALLNTRFKRGSLARFYARASLCPKCKLGEMSLSDTFREAILDFRERSLPLGWILSNQSLDYVRGNLMASDCPLPVGSTSYVTADAKHANSCLYRSIYLELRE